MFYIAISLCRYTVITLYECIVLSLCVYRSIIMLFLVCSYVVMLFHWPVVMSLNKHRNTKTPNKKIQKHETPDLKDYTPRFEYKTPITHAGYHIQDTKYKITTTRNIRIPNALPWNALLHHTLIECSDSLACWWLCVSS